jgi:hypothetical protein
MTAAFLLLQCLDRLNYVGAAKPFVTPFLPYGLGVSSIA